jgi:hypothetical protein
VIDARRDWQVKKVTRIIGSWRPLLYTAATMATLALAAGAKWRPR